MPDAKTKRVNIYMTEKEYEKCKYYAEKANMTIPAFVRHCIMVYFSAKERMDKVPS